MKIAAVVSEFNPFHNGHMYLLDMIRSLGYTHVISIMSGDFVQRGEAAVMSKWSRTRSALCSGVDLVFELPVIFSVSGAERFAMGAVSILNSLNVVDGLVFGSECGEIQKLKDVSDFLLSQDFKRHVKSKVNGNLNFAKAREDVVREILGEDRSKCLSNPNDILGIEYIKALSLLKSEIISETVKRAYNAHDSLTYSNNFASASMIRALIYKRKRVENFMPKKSFEILSQEIAQKNAPAQMMYAERALIARLRCMNRDDLKNVLDVNEGLENRIFDAVKNSVSLQELYTLVKTKRYTHARIRRIVLSAFLGLTKEYNDVVPDYVRVLGFNDRGREILRVAKKKSCIRVVTRAADLKNLDDDSKKILDIENRSEDLFSIFTPEIKRRQFHSSIYLKNW